MVHSALLGMWGRLFIVGGAICIFLIVILLVFCYLHKSCLGFLLLTRENVPNNGKQLKDTCSEKDSILWSNVYYKKAQNNVYLTGCNGNNVAMPHVTSMEKCNSLPKGQLMKRDSAYSSMSEYSCASAEQLLMEGITDCSFANEVNGCEASRDIDEGPAEMSFSIQYMPVSTKKEGGKLILTVKEAKKLPGRKYMGGACNPYVKVVILHQKPPLSKKSSTVKTFHTKTIRHTTNPKYEQAFMMDTSIIDLKNFIVKFVVMDEDKYGNSTQLGQTEQALKDVKGLFSHAGKMSFKFSLKPPRYNSGEVQFALNYLPTAKRLTVSVLKADHLNYLDIVDDISEFYPFVRILLLSPSGRIYRKKKTSAKDHTDKPIWNQDLIFDLGPHKLENITFMIIVCTTPAECNEVGSSWSSGCPMRPQVGKREDVFLGKVVLGLRVAHAEERTHWQEIISSPRKIISKWHTLK